MIINDDLDALATTPQRLGRGCALALEQAFWTLVLANTGSFFGSGNSNQITDTLGTTGLGNAVKTMRQLTDADGNPLAIEPKYLVVPPELETTADGLYASNNIVVTGSTDSTSADANVFAGKYKPLTCPYLSNQTYTGYSTTA
jgi:hypothetical protein